MGRIRAVAFLSCTASLLALAVPSVASALTRGHADRIALAAPEGTFRYRDLLGASRKFAIALLDYFDHAGVTVRVGDARRLRARP